MRGYQPDQLTYAPGSWVVTLRFILLLALLALCFLLGGASRNDVPGLLILQPAAVIIAVLGLVLPGSGRWRELQAPLLLLAALAVIMAAQLVPIPPSFWERLPGHQPFAAMMAEAGLDPVWRPISLAPDLTRASLAGLVVPGAVLVLLAGLPADYSHRLLPYIIAGVGLSALIGAAQVAGGPQSGFYLFDVTDRGRAVGLFANRNHQADLLAMSLPMLAVWAFPNHGDRGQPPFRLWFAAALAVFILPILVITGSRAGLALAVAAAGFAAIILRGRSRPANARIGRGWLLGLGAGAVLLTTALVVTAIGLSRAEAIERLFSVGAEDARLQAWPTLFRIAGDFFPLGTGFGSFDPVFRYYEPLELLKPRYLNHAHNDLIELVITGGVAALIVLAGFCIWAVPRLLRAIRRPGAGPAGDFARLAAAIIVVLFLSSLVDYPLRTPLLAALFAIACDWLAVTGRARVSRGPAPPQ